MLTDTTELNGMPVRTEIRIPKDGDTDRWLSSVVICQDTSKGTFVVWSVYATAEQPGYVHTENGIYDIKDYGRALEKAVARACVGARDTAAPAAPEHNCVFGDKCPY